MSDKVLALLAANGIQPGEEALAQYGVKGMRWGKNKTIEELQAEQRALEDAMSGKNSTESDIVNLNGNLRTYSSKEDVEAWAKNKNTNAPFDVTKTSKTYDPKTKKFETKTATRQGRVNAFVEGALKNAGNLFDRKVKTTVNIGGRTANVEKTQQGTVNRKVESFLKNVFTSTTRTTNTTTVKSINGVPVKNPKPITTTKTTKRSLFP